MTTSAALIKKEVLFTAPQGKRVGLLQTTAPDWFRELKAGEQLVVGIPAVLGDWDKCTALVLEPEMGEQFQKWVREYEVGITGANYCLPALTAQFLLVIIDQEFDPRIHPLPEGSSKELLGTMVSLSNMLNEYEQQKKTA